MRLIGTLLWPPASCSLKAGEGEAATQMERPLRRIRRRKCAPDPRRWRRARSPSTRRASADRRSVTRRPPQLTTSCPTTDRSKASMFFVAYTKDDVADQAGVRSRSCITADLDRHRASRTWAWGRAAWC